MSLDSYYCFCCLSTNDLTSLFEDAGKSYVKMLEYMFSFKSIQEDCASDSYICAECVHCLQEAHDFKARVLQTINLLQKQGLIELHKINGELVIKKGSPQSFTGECERDHKIEIVDVKTALVDVKVDVKCENEDFEPPKCKPIITTMITQPMLKVNIDPIAYDTKVTGDGMADIVKKHPVQNTKVVVQEIETAIKNELERDTNTDTVESERDKTTIENNSTNKNKIKSYEVPDDLICKICAKKLPNLYVYHTHMNEHMPHHICENCGKGFPNRIKLRRHTYSHQTGPFICDTCGDIFDNYNTYSSHRRRLHSPTLQYACPHCPARFQTFARRTRHLRELHEIQHQYACEECGKVFHMAGTLSTHMRYKHMHVKRHTCLVCNAAFFLRADLVAHVTSSHGGRHAHICQHCGKRYPRKNALKVHMRTHTNDRPYACALCDKAFTQKCTLVAHVKVHTRPAT